jgi:hypothetical protein
MATAASPSPSSPVESAEPPPKRESRWRRYSHWLAIGAHSKGGVWVVIGALLLTLTVVTIGFVYFGLPPRYIPLYEADAEVAIVAAALYAIVVEWKGGLPKER